MKIVVVIPAYKVSKHILKLISGIGKEVDKIIVVDDACPENSASLIEANCLDPRVIVLKNKINLGVGGAVMVGYQKAIELGATVVVKIDGDGQMDPCLISDFIDPIINGEADYTKGNRFYNLDRIHEMPKIRLLGNAALSFLTKLSSGYWNLFDPTNGYTAIHSNVLKKLPLDKISRRYFFESDMLFRLNIMRAVVVDVPMDANYGDEVSNLKIRKVCVEFLGKNLKNTFKRIFYNYYLRDMSVASIELPVGLLMLIFGLILGALSWVTSVRTGVVSPTGTIVLSSMSIMLGLQFILAFIAYDVSSIPSRALHKKLKGR